MYAEDTIAAIATPPGAGAIGIVRASGPSAERIANDVFRRPGGGSWETHRLYRGSVIGRERAPLDQALAVLMRAPQSYTGEDVFEIYCHGSPLVLRLALDSMLRSGARPAGPGEFTRRAFLNGKIDLTQAEAIVDLVRARTPEGASRAAEQLGGGLSRHLDELRRRLVGIKAELEVRIDFVDEDLDLDDRSLVERAERLRRDLAGLLDTYARGRIAREGLAIAITGRPNVGKSSLLNALLGQERAIVTPVPGTTRDVLEECADFAGVPVVLSDTAGLRDTNDEVERIGVERARFAVEQADVVVLVLDSSLPPEPLDPAWQETGDVIIALNKVDLPSAWTDTDVARLRTRFPVVPVSATQRIGLDELRAVVVGSAARLPPEGTPVLTSARQRDALCKVLTSVDQALSSWTGGLPPDLVAVDIQTALDHVGSITGLVASEEVLDTIFSQFCIGK